MADYVVSRPRRSLTLQLLASALMGAGIVTMHYSGMAAMQMSPPITYDPTLFVLSALIAGATSWAALALVFRERGDSGIALGRRLSSAVVMGIAIAGMHYTGMAAAHFEPGSVCTAATTGLSGSSIALFVGLVVVLVLVASLALTFFDEVVGENNFYKALLAAQSAAGEGVVLLERGKVVYANSAMERLSGYTESELKALPSWDHWIERVSGKAESGLSGDALLHTRGRTEVTMKTRLGAAVPCEVVASSFRHAQSTRYLLVCIDISERKASQEALQASNEQARELAMVASRTDNAVIITDAEGRITWVNAGFERISGYTLDEAVGRISAHLLQDPETDPMVLQSLRDGVARGVGVEAELVNVHKSGRKYWVSIDLQPVRDAAGQIVKFIAIERDITEKKLAEQSLLALNATLEQRVDERTRELRGTMEQLQSAQSELILSEKMASLGSLVAGISHELNTPIGNSLTVASTMQEQAHAMQLAVEQGLTRSRLVAFAKGMEEGADILVRSLQRAARLVVSFKQVAVDQASVNRRRFELHATVSDSLTMLGPMLRKTSHVVSNQIPEGIWIDSYPGPLGQVVTNLITNALVHGFDGRERGLVQVSARRVDQTHVEVVVQDDGVGIDAEHLSRVFDPFFTTKLGRGGSGLGLNIVYNLVTTKLGGRIKVESTPGHGACFTVLLPIDSPDSH